MYFKKNYFSTFFNFFFWRYYPFRRFFWKNHSSLTSVVGHISHYATHRWKALEEYIPNIYTFMAQNYVNFLINSLIIFTILMKKYLNWTHLRINISKKYFLDSIFLYTPNDSILNVLQKNYFSKFFDYSFWRY